jgi:hypothetical protein
VCLSDMSRPDFGFNPVFVSVVVWCVFIPLVGGLYTFGGDVLGSCTV